MASVLRKGGNLDTGRRIICEDTGRRRPRDRSDAGKPRNAQDFREVQKLEEVSSLPWGLRGSMALSALTSDV